MGFVRGLGREIREEEPRGRTAWWGNSLRTSPNRSGYQSWQHGMLMKRLRHLRENWEVLLS